MRLLLISWLVYLCVMFLYVTVIRTWYDPLQQRERAAAQQAGVRPARVQPRPRRSRLAPSATRWRVTAVFILGFYAFHLDETHCII